MQQAGCCDRRGRGACSCANSRCAAAEHLLYMQAEQHRMLEETLAATDVGHAAVLARAGIVSDEIKMGIKNSRSGNYNMRLSGHILILNW